MALKYYICEHCGNIAALTKSAGVPLVCCGQKMTEIKPGTTDAAVEKHLPVITQDGRTVKVAVGTLAHPMLDAHYIEWISIETKEGSQIKYLQPGAAPEVTFALSDSDELIAAYAYCNLHSLWMTEA